VAAEELMPGRRIEAAQLRLEPYDGPPGWPEVSQVVGRAPRKSIPSGSVIEASMLMEGLDVLRGEHVRVEVSCGRARVLLEGEAQAAGKRGQTILVRNPGSGKVFPARIAAQGAVSVAAPGEGERQ
jgi:flagellar basal body P-ring formation protein FlgA